MSCCNGDGEKEEEEARCDKLRQAEFIGSVSTVPAVACLNKSHAHKVWVSDTYCMAEKLEPFYGNMASQIS